MSRIVAYAMHQSGPIPNMPGWFSGGQTVYVDVDERVVVSTSPFRTPPFDDDEAAEEQESVQAEAEKASE